PIQYDQRAARYLQRHRLDLRPGSRVELGRDQLGTDAMETLPQRTAMRAGQSEQAAIVPIGVVQRDPESRDRRGPRVQVSRVLVPADFRADLWLLEEIHRLQQQRSSVSQRRSKIGQKRLA